MMEVRRRQRYLTARQKQKLIELVTKHPELISCKVTPDFNYKDSRRLWQEIANECNSIHLGARKSWRQWRKTWQDLRSKSKKRQSEANGELLASTPKLTRAEQEGIGLENIESPEFQKATEFIPVEDNSLEMFKEEWSGSSSERDSPIEDKIMEVRRRQKYLTAEQKQKLIELVTKHPELISCKVKPGFSHKDSRRLWQEIANECNSIQLGARKSWRQWRKTWQDMKSKSKKTQGEANGEVLDLAAKLTNIEEEALGLENIESSELQESTEFIPVEDNSLEMCKEECSSSESDSPIEDKVVNNNSSSIKNRQLNHPKHRTKHKCYFNCDLIAVQEQRNIRMKEDYLNFKKDYLRQKLKLLKEQTEALKSIAKELSS